MDRKRSNQIALISIRIFSAVSIAILIVILGYLLFRGLRYSNRKEIKVIPIASINNEFNVYANKSAKLDYLDWFTLQSMAMGRVRTLRTISKVNEKFHLYIDPRVSDQFYSYLATDKLDKFIIKDSTAINYKEDKGGMIVLPITESAPSGYRSIKIYDNVVVVNKEVTQLLNNKKIGAVTLTQIEELKNNKIDNWNSLNGPSLKPDFIANASESELANNPGSISIVKAKEYSMMKNVETLDVVNIESGWNISLDYLLSNSEESGSFGGIFSIIVNTLIMIFLVILISTPIGLGAAVYLSQYAKKGRITTIIRSGIDLLAGVPSIIFGLFGMLVFVQLFGWSFSLISGSLTLSLMILPTIIRTSEESINSVDKNMISASRGLGATKIETIFKIVLPAAKNGIVTGIILAVGRALGETAALVFTIGSSTDIASKLTSSSRVLAQHIYLTIIEGQSIDHAFSAALVLIILELIINTTAKKLMNKGKKNGK
ncbi:MAG: phosphate ABC transporter permease PstA [Spirochaetaceae bacterium]|nr:phosphate ABC transporter permease PstA [Spirochaetaceae bacterium]